MPSKKTVLIVDDSDINRRILSGLLAPEYDLLEAGNGREALGRLQENTGAVSCILLDLVMPVMDGFELLKAMSGKEEYKNIPVIVETGSSGEESEVNALSLGAWDFITKPYNGGIIRFRLRNAIERSQLSAFKRLKYLAEYDPLTEIYNKPKFFKKTQEMLGASPNEAFVFVRLDIDRFSLINSFFGADAGDGLLRHIAQCLRVSPFGGPYAYGRMEADIFAACFSYSDKDAVIGYLERLRDQIKAYKRSFDIAPVFGVFYLDDPALDVSEMLDRATLAAKTRKGNCVEPAAVYDPEMSRRLEKEQEIINEMASALEQDQFCLYLQPKYSLETNAPVGAEALVRWRHPEKGLIPPGVFIPVFEKNGFISKLDYAMWEAVCRLLQKWLREGRDPAPLSVNVSRVDLYNPQIVRIISELTDRYGIPPRLLELELTESAYIDNPSMMQTMVEQLHEKGFTVMMDDFGSGYSSLSVLKDIRVDMLKIDTRFFDDAHVAGRGENIVASIVRMAKWLNIPAVAEGVEREEQVDFLRSVGCDYVQGFYFARPMPIDEYERLIGESGAALVPSPVKSALDLNTLWGCGPEITLFFSNDTQAKAIYEFDGDTVEVLRVNQAFNDLFGYGGGIVYSDPFMHVLPDYQSAVRDAYRSCAESHGVVRLTYLRLTPDGRTLRILLELQFIGQVGTKQLLIGHMTDLGGQVEAADKSEAEPDGGREFDLNRSFSARDMLALLAFLRQVFDVARLVDPSRGAVVELDGDGGMRSVPYTCFRVWGKNTRCENCTGEAALDENCRLTKYEYIKNDVFYVVSNPVFVRRPHSVDARLALEIVSHVSDHLTMGIPGVRSIDQMVEETQRKIYTDEMTGAYNRRYLNELLFAHKNGSAQKLGLVMIDLWAFKQINDSYGHAMGDDVLAHAAQKLMGAVRPEDSVIRYGGDEFVVTLVDRTEEQVRNAVAEMRAQIEAVPYGQNGDRFARADFGYACTDIFDMRRESLDELLRAADAAMYDEKNKRRSDG